MSPRSGSSNRNTDSTDRAQRRAGFTMFENSKLDLLARFPMPDRARRLVMVIERHTTGFHRPSGKFPVRRLARLGGMDAADACRARAWLVDHQVLAQDPTNKEFYINAPAFWVPAKRSVRRQHDAGHSPTIQCVGSSPPRFDGDAPTPSDGPPPTEPGRPKERRVRKDRKRPQQHKPKVEPGLGRPSHSPSESAFVIAPESTPDVAADSRTAQLDPEALMSLYNALIPAGHAKATRLTERRVGAAHRALAAHPSRMFWEHAFGAISGSTFLRGQAPPKRGFRRPFIATFDWFLKQTGHYAVQAAEGKYHDTEVVETSNDRTASPLASSRDVSCFIETYRESFREKHRRPPRISTNEQQVVAELVRTYTIRDLLNYLDDFIADPTLEYSWSGYSLSGFAKSLNKLIVFRADREE